MRTAMALGLASVFVLWSTPARADQPHVRMQGQAATLTFHQGAAGPGLPVAAIARRLRQDLARLRACYSPIGVSRVRHVKVSWAIRGTGGVELVAVSGGAGRMNSCIQRALAALTFPRPRGNRVVPVYFEFHYTGAPMNLGVGGSGPIGTHPHVPLGAHPPVPRVPRPRLQFVSLTSVGKLDKAIVRRYLRRSWRRLEFCYERQLLVRAGLRGLLNATFTIDGQGSVPAATVGGVNKTLSDCVARQLRLIRFPKPKAGSVGVQLRARAIPEPGQRPQQHGRTMEGFRAVLALPGGSSFDPNPTLRKDAPRIRRCFSRIADKNKGLAGKVSVVFDVETSGKPVRLTAWGLPRVAGCVAYVMRKMSFPSGAELKRVRYELHFGATKKPHL